MTDVRELEQRVIEAARVISRCNPGGECPSHNQRLRVAIEELDAALEPDPWQLLRSVRNMIPADSTPRMMCQRAIDDALAWRDKQETA